MAKLSMKIDEQSGKLDRLGDKHKKESGEGTTTRLHINERPLAAVSRKNKKKRARDGGRPQKHRARTRRDGAFYDRGSTFPLKWFLNDGDP